MCTETDSQFNKVHKTLTDLENSLQDMQERIRTLENNTEEHGVELKNNSELTIKNSQKIEDLEAEIRNLKDNNIPKNITAQHNKYIKDWENDEATFLETRATHHILTSLPSNHCIIVTGSSGCGKSFNIHHTALYLRDRYGYVIIPVLTGPTDILDYYDENKKQVFVVDDICGKESVNLQTLHMWRDSSDKLKHVFKSDKSATENETDGKISELSCSKLLISCRLHIYKEAQFQLVKFFTRKECNLLSPEWCLQQEERINMMQKYLPGDIRLTDYVKNVTDHVDFFPLLCKLSKGKSSDEVIKLLTAPENSITKNINHIVFINKAQFCALVICILFNDTDWLTLKSTPGNKKSKLINIVKEFEIDLSSETARNTLKAGFSTLDETYFKRQGKEYRMIHDKIYKMAAIICGNQLTGCFIRYAPTEFIRDNFVFESNIEVSANDDLIILSQDKEEDYFGRLLMDFKNSTSASTFHNKQMIYQSFRDKLISFFGRSDDAKQLLLAFDAVYRSGCVVKSDKKEFLWFYKDTTPLMVSASCGYFDIVSFLIDIVKCDVNQINCEGKSPLYKACEWGKTDVVIVLLQKNASLNHRNNRRRMFPFIVACLEGHTEIVKLLLKKDADVYQCNLNEESPLYVACRRGNIDIVELLFQNHADVSQCNKAGKSPLYAACKRGHIDTLKLLLQNNADISKCSVFGSSPLFVACKGGHTETVKLLLQENAVVSQCNKYGMSPLFAACSRGHTDTVQLLLQHNADIALCGDNIGSLLHVACLRGHTDTVKLLLRQNSDVDLCGDNGGSLLYVACLEWHTDLVKLLLQNNTDVSCFNFFDMLLLFVVTKNANLKSLSIEITNMKMESRLDSIGETALYVACENGHTDTVNMLLGSQPDVSKGTTNGKVPLHAACIRGYKEIIKLLLKHKANISQCNMYDEFALFIACENGHTSTAELLLQNKADVDQCNSKGESSLYVACKRGHRDTVELLLQCFADVSQCENHGGNSPLHAVCDSSSSYPRGFKRRVKKKDPECLEIIKLSIANGADVKVCNKNGKTPLDIARESNFLETVNFLQEHLLFIN